MSRIPTTLHVPKGMYRHFSVITLLATGCIAIFADGERRQSISDEINAQNQKSALRQHDADKNGATTVARHEIHYASRGGWGSDGIVDTDPVASAQGAGYAVSDGSGAMRIAGGGDFGVLGPITPAELRNGKFPITKTGPAPRTGSLKTVTAEQRRAFERALSARAGAPTPAD